MRKGVIKAGVLSAIFIVSIILFSIMTNQVNEDLTMEMADASLPILTLYSEGTEINQLHGYTKEMDAAYMRDSITPIPKNRILPIKINTYKKEIIGISYEIRSLDAKRLIANANVQDFQQERGIIHTQLKIQNLLEEGEEYLLIICLESEKEKISYYTRITEPVDCYVQECLDFAEEFHHTTFHKAEADALTTYLEYGEADNTTLQFCNLNSSLKQICWADFGGERFSEPIPSIKEITPTYNVIVMNYVMTRVGENGASEYYNVEEYYRIRYTKQRMYLLNFERTVNEIFRGENANLYGTYLSLGIRSGNVEYKASDTGNIVAFVQEGELWSYNQNENTLAKVFSFRGYEGIDERENYNAHDIKVINVDEAGSITYIVYGYMNRGIHEGEVGIAIFRYDSLANTNEEALFIPSTQSYEVMKSDLGQLMYVNEGGMFFIMMGGTVYSVDLNSLETKELITGVENSEFAVSESNRLFAWSEMDDEYGSQEISVIDFMTEQTAVIRGNGQEYLRPLGFIQEDLVYGAAKMSEVGIDAAGKILYPMFRMNIAKIASGEIEILKTYEKEGYYISEIEIDGFTIYLERMTYNGSAYVETSSDMIMNREGNSGKLVSVREQQTEGKQTQVELVLKKSVGEKAPELLAPKDTLLEEVRGIAIEHTKRERRYYVYAKGKVVFSATSAAKAITKANETNGAVIDDNQQCIWKRSRKTVQNVFKDMSVGEEDRQENSIVQCINALLGREGISTQVGSLIAQGKTPMEILNTALREETVLDLTGCSVDEVEYYISNGAPVFAMSSAKEAVLLIGYDASTVAIFDPVKNVTYRKNLAEAEAMFAEAGRVFFSYLK